MAQTSHANVYWRIEKRIRLFMWRLNDYLESNSTELSAKLKMRRTACTGEMKDSLISYTQLEPEEGHKEAVNMLQNRLGSSQDHMDEAI